jgi:hypothetical protein
MSRKVIDTGIVGNDGTGDSIRDSFRKVNENFRELYGALGLGSRLKFSTLEDAPVGGEGEDYYQGYENAVVAVNPNESGLIFKQLTAGTGVSLNFSNENQIIITNTRSSLANDPAPSLGGNLQAQSGSTQYRIQSLTTPITSSEAANKGYTDTKIALGGVFAPDPGAGNVANSAFGTMTGPLILSRNPEPEDDVTYGGLIAATKNYVDNAGFASVANLYVATSGSDERVGVGSNTQGRALAFAYRTLEAALKKAEEIIKSSPPEIGPYRKVLTWTNPDTGVISNCSLTDIAVSPDNGTGFAGRVTLTIDTIRLVLGGYNFKVNETLRINKVGGAAIDAATVRILTVNSEPGTPNGPILTFQLLTGGKFDLALPVTNFADRIVVGVANGSEFGTSAEFAVTYKVSTAIISSAGTGYSLVSVRVTPDVLDTDAVAGFGFADIVGGVIAGITITDQGSNFTEFPDLVVTLPRFEIYTGGQRTDFTGDVTTDSAVARRGRDIREGLYLLGETSGALAQILSHQGELDTNGNELFDVDIKYGTFVNGEAISYGDVANTRQVAVFVETGIYYENLPLKISQNVAVIGDEFRRTIIRPKKGMSSSPWAFQYFKRDKVIDGLNTSRNDLNAAREDPFGYHYLSNAGESVYPESNINNKGFYRSAADLLSLNKQFIQEEVIAWINKQIVEEVAPFVDFEYNSNICKRDVGLLIDAMVFDLRYGSAPRTISAALKYKDATNASATLAITTQLTQTIAAIRRLETVAQAVIRNIDIINSQYLAPITGTLITYAEPQVIDTAYTAETGAGGTPVTVSAVTRGNQTTITTSTAHGFDNGEIVTFRNMTGLTELNGNSYWITIANSTQFNIYTNSARTANIVSTSFAAYNASSGDCVPNGGVIGRLTDVIVDIIDTSSESFNTPLDNDQMDVFLMNDATILRAATIQGAGGFALVLDPEGQILAKSPYAQEGAVFSKSTGRHTFSGGMFVDGFAGNIKFRITSKTSNTRLVVDQLKRFPQLPASFIVQDTVYRINYVRDFTYGTSGSTATLVLDEVTPWPFDVFTYDQTICNRDVGLIITGLGYDIVLGTNYHSRRAAQSYREANAEVVIEDQLDLTIRAIDRAHDRATATLEAIAVSSEFNPSLAVVSQSKINLRNIIRRGTTAAPALSITNPTGLTSNRANAKVLLVSNTDFLKQVGTGYLTTTYPSLTFSAPDSQKDIERILDSLIYDLVYGGNSETRKAAFAYFNGVGDALVIQLLSTQPEACENALTTVKNAAKQVIVNTTVSPTYGATSTQVTGSASDGTVVGEIETLMSIITTALSTYRVTAGSEAVKLAAAVASLPAEVLPKLTAASGGYDYDATRTSARVALESAKSTIQANVIEFVNENANVYEVLMPGNRSMLSNDFTQINDMGYGLIAANGGLTECVSMFTYYCYTSYYSVTGGQIRGVGGSSAHGVYALAAEGSDPLEVPTAVDLYYELAQGAVVYNDGGAYDNDVNGFIIYITDYTYPPRDQSEIEVDHGGATGLVRYPVVSAVTESDFPSDSTGQKLYRLNLNSDTDGFVAAVPNGTRVTLRTNNEVVLTGGVVGIAVRPSTALKLNELFDSQLYRVLEFADYFPPINEAIVCTFITGTETLVQTSVAHGQQPGYAIKFATSGSLPTGISAGDTYYLLDDGFTATTFKFSSTKTGQPLETTTAGSGSHYFEATGLAATALKDGYNYAEITLWPRQEFVPVAAPTNPGGPRLIVGATEIVSGYSYYIVTVGTTVWTSIGSAANTVTTVFTASGAGSGTGTAVVNTARCTFTYTTDRINKTSHGFNDGDIIRFETSGVMPAGVFTSRQYTVANKTTNDFQIVSYSGGTAIDFSDNGTGIFAVGKVLGRVGDSVLSVVELGPVDADRIVGTKLTFKGRDYSITQYNDADITGEPYGEVYLNTPLEDSVIVYDSPITLFAGVAARTEDSQGTLTIRISLTRVTGHDLLEIGTGSYADTNYPNEIYGSPVRIATETLLDTTGEVEYSQVVERGEGRCFFVTTDQFGNFSVGPFFRVDQGTGTVTFSASLALSNLSGLGFKRGVPISEFSTDTTFSDNATDTVPTENATRGYMDRRLGVSHGGDSIDSGRLIPPTTGGYMALTGQLAMKGSLNMDSYRVRNLADPVELTDAVNLRSVKFASIIENSFVGQVIQSRQMIVFTGVGYDARAVEISGDVFIPEDGITTGIDSTANVLNIFVKPDIIDNANINSAAAIAQSKLSMVTASTRAAAAGITQADRGLASFNSAEFTLTNGWVELKTNGVELGKFAQIATDTVLGRSAAGTGDVSAVAFSTIVDEGSAIKKSQYSSLGFLRRTGATTSSQDSDYGIVEAVSAYAGFTDVAANNKLVIRDSNGDIGVRDSYATRAFYVGTSASVNKKLADTSVTATGGSINLYGFSSVLGVSIGDGSLSSDKVSSYRNNSHRFRLNDDSAFAPIQVSSIITPDITTGGVATAGSLTGNWSMATTSNLTLGTGTINASTGTLQSITLTTGAVGTAGTLTGAWSLNSTSKIIGQTGSEIDFTTGTIKSRTFTTGANITTGNLTGNWSLTSGSKIDFSIGTLQSTTLTTGATATAGVITGQWSVAVGSSIDTGGSTLTTAAISTGAPGTAGTIEGNWSMLTTSNLTWGTGYLDMRTGTFYTDTVTTGAVGTAGVITGNWSMDSTSNITWGTGYLDMRTGTLYSDTLTTGASGTAGLVTGSWTVDTGSTFVASTIQSQANSATITATTANTGSTIVLRDASGNFSAGLVTVTGLTIGSDTIAEYISDTVGAMVNSNTESGISVTYDDADNTLDFDVADFSITLTGDVTGTGTVTNLGNVSFVTTISADATVLGTDTTGQYATTVAISGNGLSCTTPNAADGTAYTITSNATNLNTASTTVFRDASGNFSAGTITAALSGNASTASAWATGRTITLTGDVTGVSAAFDGGGNLSFATTIAANSVALGTDTTGDYVGTGAVSGNGLSGSATGEGSTFTVTSNATSANTGSTIVFRDSNGDFSARIMTGTATAARYADLAERYAADREYPVGTVVVFGGDKEITTTNTKMDTAVAGVISANPAFRMNCEAGEDSTHPYVALAGRVPCRVAGKIKKGNIMVTSGIPGVAVAAVGDIKVGSMIGKALEDYDSDHIGTIEVAVGRA